jgi:hypothetical protein
VFSEFLAMLANTERTSVLKPRILRSPRLVLPRLAMNARALQALGMRRGWLVPGHGKGVVLGFGRGKPTNWLEDESTAL